jgi:HupE / UreJ protein
MEAPDMWSVENSVPGCRCKSWVLGPLVALCLTLGSAVAHKVGTTSYATLSVVGQTVRYALTLPADGIALDHGTLTDFAAAISEALEITADGAACAGVPAEVRPASPQRASIEIVVLYACRGPIRNLHVIHGTEALLGTDHHTIADFQWPGGTKQVVFEIDHREADVAIADEAAADGGAMSTFASYFGIGVEHILLGFDHILFIIALILPGGRLVSLAAMVTAFTLAHSLTLALSVLNIVTVPAAIVEPVIALSIAYVAFENLALKGAPSRRWAVSFVFGLVHGFGFAGALAEVGLPTQGLVSALVGFNLGVEAGQLLVVALLLPLILWLQRFSWEPRLAKLSSSAILAVGLVLLAERALIV